ncbi:MAG TPA: glucose-6-phosphate dehydrogenase [Actinomycetota bacterium]|nr:glucose-6-phosphate dehydrogenase [Actinomycetota bacterium]
MSPRRRPPDQTIVIFGASGDLTSRKLVPALYALHRDGLMPQEWKVVGYARTPRTDDEFRSDMRSAVEQLPEFEDASWRTFAPRLNYVTGTFAERKAMAHLERELNERDAPPRRLFYCGTPPSAFEQIVRRIGEEQLQHGASIVVEKPFGSDLASARRLNTLVHKVFSEDQVFRIDHYLGKETVQNILVFRFSNGMFEPIWNRRYVKSVEVTVAEADGVGHRGSFYEEAGALRDIVQNHILQMITILGMEPPISFDPEALRDEKAKVLAAVRPVDPAYVVRGQYDAGRVGRSTVTGYRQEQGVSARSQVETYVAMKLWVDTWRWAEVPFYVRTGKRLPRRVTEVTMSFHDAPHILFRQGRPSTNYLTIRIQPDEGIRLSFDAKSPGPDMRITPVDMEFSYSRWFDVEPPEAYERLLRDAMLGDHTLFPRADEVERSWEVLGPALEAPPRLRRYAAGSWGPDAADALIEPGRWRLDGR